MFKNLPIWADTLLRVIAIIIIFVVLIFFAMVFYGCSHITKPTEESYYNVSNWEYIGSATFSHLEYKSISLDSYTIYYMQNGKVCPVRRMQDGFERGQLVHIYRKWTVDGYKYKVFGDPIHERRKER